jgi:hypothetical protein
VCGESGCCNIHNNILTDNRFFVIVIDDGNHTISNTKIFRGDVGVAAVVISSNTIAMLEC